MAPSDTAAPAAQAHNGRPVTLRVTGSSDVGLQRDHNEDTFCVLEKYRLFVVADGMGGHQAGDVASKLAGEAVAQFFDATQKEDATWPFPIDPNLSLAENRLSASIKVANRRIFEKSCSDHSMQGMGTTIVALVIPDGSDLAFVAHVGDSRAYRVRDGQVEQLTRDHSLINDYLMMMPDMPQEAMDVLPKNVITRALGMQDSVVVDIATERVLPGDKYLLCSDGLSGQVTDERLGQVLDEFGDDLEAAAAKLVRLANDAGGEDNVTVVLVSCS